MSGRILAHTFLSFAALAAGVALAAQLGRFSERLDALTHVMPFWLFAGVVCAAIAARLLSRPWRRVAAALGVITVISAMALAAPDFLGSSATVPTRADSIKIVQFNAWYQNEDSDKSIKWLLEQDADIVILEEAKLQARPIQLALRQRYPFRVTCGGLRGCPTMIFSKHKPIAFSGLQTGRSAGAQPVAGVWAQYQDARGVYTVAAVHLSWPAVPANLQSAQFKSLDRALSPLPKDRLILAGDFNSTPWSFALRAQERELGLIRRTHHLASFPARAESRLFNGVLLPIFPIDHVFAGRGWQTSVIRRGPRLGSDHYPLVAVLTPAPLNAVQAKPH